MKHNDNVATLRNFANKADFGEGMRDGHRERG